MNDWQICLNPFIYLIFEFLQLFLFKLVIAGKVETHALSRNIRATLVTFRINQFLNCRKQKMCCSVILRRHFAVIFEAALKHTLAGCLTAIPLLFERSIELFAPVFAQLNIFTISLFDGQLHWEAISILQHKDLFAGQTRFLQLAKLLDTAIKRAAESLLFFAQNGQDFFAMRQDTIWQVLIILGNRRQNLFEEVLFNTKIQGLQNRTANNTAKRIAMLLITRHKPLRSQKVGTTKMICNNTHFRRIAIVTLTRNLF